MNDGAFARVRLNYVYCFACDFQRTTERWSLLSEQWLSFPRSASQASFLPPFVPGPETPFLWELGGPSAGLVYPVRVAASHASAGSGGDLCGTISTKVVLARHGGGAIVVELDLRPTEALGVELLSRLLVASDSDLLLCFQKPTPPWLAGATDKPVKLHRAFSLLSSYLLRTVLSELSAQAPNLSNLARAEQRPFPFIVLQLQNGTPDAFRAAVGDEVLAGLTLRTYGVPKDTGPDALDPTYFGARDPNQFLTSLFPIKRLFVSLQPRSCMIMFGETGGLTKPRLIEGFVETAAEHVILGRILWARLYSLNIACDALLIEHAAELFSTLGRGEGAGSEALSAALVGITKLRTAAALALCDPIAYAAAVGAYVKLCQAMTEAFRMTELVRDLFEKLVALDRLYSDLREVGSLAFLQKIDGKRGAASTARPPKKQPPGRARVPRDRETPSREM